MLAAAVVLVVTRSPGWHEFKAYFLDWSRYKDSFPEISHAFGLNVKIFVIAEAIILFTALGLAVIRSLPGPVFFPLRALAIGGEMAFLHDEPVSNDRAAQGLLHVRWLSIVRQFALLYVPFTLHDQHRRHPKESRQGNPPCMVMTSTASSPEFTLSAGRKVPRSDGSRTMIICPFTGALRLVRRDGASPGIHPA